MLIATTALTLALPLAGCMHGDSGNATTPDVDQRIETQMEENEDCPDGKCPDGKCDGKVDKLPEDRNGKCPDGNCPAKLLPPHNGRNGRIAPMPRPKKSF